MLKRLFALVAVILVVALVAPALPVRAQEGGEFPIPPACTAEDQTQLTDLVLDIGMKFADAGNSVSPDGPDDYAALALAMNEVKAYLYGDEIEIPFCTDSFVVLSALEFLVDNFIISMQLSTIYIRATEAGETEFNSLMDYGTFHIDMLTKYQEQYSTIVDAVAAKTPMLTEWFPTCTDADTSSEGYTQLLALEDSTDEQAEALSAFLTDGTVSSDLLLFMEEVLKQWEPLSDDMPMCSEIFWRELYTGALYYDITIAVGWGVMTAYTEGDLNAQVLAARDAAAENLTSDIEYWEETFGEEVAAE